MSETGKWMGVVAFAAFCGGVYLLVEDDTRPAAPAPVAPAKPERTLPMSESAFAQATIKRASGQAIEPTSRLLVLGFRPGDIQLRIAYPREVPVTSEVAVEDAVLIVRAAVETLMAAGWNPRTEQTTVTVAALQEGGPSITGAATVRQLGRATYDYSDDRIVYEQP